MHTKARGKQLSIAAAQLMLALAQPEAAATADGAANVGDRLGDLSLSIFTNFTESMMMEEAGQSVIDAAPANKEQAAGSAGEMGAGANAKAAVRCLVAVLTVICYCQASNITGCHRAIQYFQANKEAKEAEPSVSKASPNDKEQAAGYSGVTGTGDDAHATV
jgi:hypothetical protein